MEFNWIEMNSLNQLDEILKNSHNYPQVIFKHSTTCSISNIAKNRLERLTISKSVLVDFYYLDLLSHRFISQEIADALVIHHESPQVLLIQNGRCVYDGSHFGINKEDLLENILNISKALPTHTE